jgi:hypothetical protein
MRMPHLLLIDLGQPACVSISSQYSAKYLAGVFSNWSRPPGQAAELRLALGVTGDKASSAFDSGKDNLRARGAYKLARWQADLTQRGEPWDIAFRALLYEEWLAVRMIIFPFLQRALLTQGRFLLPASVVRWGERTLAFVGAGSAGKTSLLLACCMAGAEFVGDDFVLASGDGTLRSLGDLVSIKAASLAENASLRARLTARQRAWLWVCTVLERVTRRGIVISLQASARQLFGQTAQAGGHSINHVILIERAGSVTQRTRAEADTLCHTILLQLRFWETYFGDLIALQRTMRGQSADYWETYRAELGRLLKQCECWRLQVGQQHGWVNQVLPLLLR